MVDNHNPLVSIVTVVFNDYQGLESTIKSVINQSYTNIEYIIIDGGSTDGTLDIIKKYKEKISYWVSEQDKGIYDAMNKGINVATGEWINFMNAGDTFKNENILQKIFTKQLNNVKLIYGNSEEYAKEDNSIHTKRSFDHNKIWYGMFAHHQAIFYNMKIIKDNNLTYDLKYLIAADYAFTYSFYNFLEDSNFLYIDDVICTFELGGISEVKKEDGLREANLIRKEIGKHSILKIFLIKNLHFMKLFVRNKLPKIYDFLRYKKAPNE